MTAIEYIHNEINRLVSEFSQIRVRYEYRPNSEVHFIEVVPNEVYHLDEDYIAWEIEAVSKFVELFPTQNICFISDDALVGIRNAEYIKEGFAFASLSGNPELIVNTPEIIMIATRALNSGWIALTERNNVDPIINYTPTPPHGYQLAA